MNKIISIVLLPVLGGLLSFVAAQSNVLSSEYPSKAMAAIYAFDESAYEANMSKVTDEAVRSYLKEYHAIMHYAAANNQTNYKSYITASDEALSRVSKHKYEATFASNLQMHRSLVELSNGSLLGGGMYFWKAYRSFKRGEEKCPGYDGQLMLRGFFDVLLSQIPDKWRSLAGFFGFGSGNLRKGFEEIEAYHAKMSSVPGLNEESLLLSFANIFLSHDQLMSDKQRAEISSNQSPVIVYAYMLSCGRNQLGKDADRVLALLPQSVRDKFPLIWQQDAKFALRRLDTSSAKRYADIFAKSYKGVSCANEAPLIKAYSLKIEGDVTAANKEAATAASMPYTSDVDKRIHNDAEAFTTMSADMLRARFLFEYGDFKGSMLVLKTITPSKSDEIEYWFRMARAEEKLGMVCEAIVHYDKVISMSGNSKRYFGPYSAVYAADIYIAQGKMDMAKKYVDKAKALNNGEFVKEIEQRISLSYRAISGDGK
ncbi:MAG: hypothetical protein MJZ13_07615 [Bacteroidales bacterium]|nr:hypothetical protein [Bacteroidales bacterium]